MSIPSDGDGRNQFPEPFQRVVLRVEVDTTREEIDQMAEYLWDWMRAAWEPHGVDIEGICDELTRKPQRGFRWRQGMRLLTRAVRSLMRA